MVSLLGMSQQQVCRCCLLENPVLTYNIYDNNLRLELCELAPTLHIEPDDGLPDVICELCLSRVRDALEFRRRCEETDRLLRQRHEQFYHAFENAEERVLDDVLESITKEIGGLIGKPQQTDDVQVQNELKSTAEDVLKDLNLRDTREIDTSEFNAYFPADYPMPASVLSASTLETSTDLVAFAEQTTYNEPIFEAMPPTLSELSNSLEYSNSDCTTATTPTAFTSPTSTTTTAVSLTPVRKRAATVSRARAKSLHPCSHCEKKFTRNFQLKLHMISVHNVGDGLRYKCEICLKTFASGHSLSYHFKSIHSEVRPFQCEHCERRFVLRTQLSSHLRIHTGETKPRIYNCTKCEKTWPTRSDLRTHMRSHNPPIVRPFQCNLCEKAFYTRGHLSSHMLVHTGEKPFACAFCDRSYQSVGNLNNHMVRQHADIIASQTCYDGNYEC